MFQKTIGGLAVLVAMTGGCATPQTTLQTPHDQEQPVATRSVELANPWGERVRATEITEHMGRYMLLESNGTPYASLRLKCGECPVLLGFVAVYEDAAAAERGSAFLSERFGESMTPTLILKETIDEHITSRYTSGRRIEPEKGPVDLKPF